MEKIEQSMFYSNLLTLDEFTETRKLNETSLLSQILLIADEISRQRNVYSYICSKHWATNPICHPCAPAPPPCTLGPGGTCLPAPLGAADIASYVHDNILMKYCAS